MKVQEVLLACDSVEAGYRIVALEGGSYAFVQGNVRAREGDELSGEEEGVDLHDTYDEAIMQWRLTASSLYRNGAKHAASELMAVLEA